MDELTFIYNDHKIIKKILIELREELRKLAIGEPIDRVMIEIARGFIVFNVLEYHHIREDELFEVCTWGSYKEIVQQIQRFHALSNTYFEYFQHYWKCYDDGQTLAKYDMISYGESYITTLLESMRLEEKLFNLTTNDCIVK